MGADGAVLQLVTRCESEDDFVERFARFTTESDVVVPALPHASVGTTGRFVIRLKDQSVVMSGRCEVSEVLPMAGAPGAPVRSARALMRLRLIEMDAHSAGIHLRLTERRASMVKPPATPALPPPTTARALSRGLSIVRTPPPVPPAAAPAPPAAAPAPPAAAPAPPAAAPVPPPPVSPINVTAVARPLPKRNAMVMTLIGVPAKLGLPGVTARKAAAPPLEIETTDVSPVPRPEARVPGAALTLPANPLSDLDGADLASFVEFTLLETEGVDSAAIISSEPTAGGALQVTQDRASVVAPAPAARPRDRKEQARQIARRAWPYVACVVAGLSAGLLLRAGKSPPPVVAAPAQVSPAEIAPPSIAPAAAPAAVPARRDCEANVTTRPAGAAVRWGDIDLGPSPIARAPIPCGSAMVAITHERYSDVTRTLTAERGQSVNVSERLSRPPARVVVTSSPTNAHIKLNKRAIGQAPRRIGALRFERVRVDASLPGYQPWTKTLYLREAETKVDVTLAPVPKPPARRAPPARAR